VDGDRTHAERDRAEMSIGQLVLAGVGWAAMGVEALDELADELARKVGVDVSDMRSAVRDTAVAWRREAERLGTRGDDAVERALERLGLARREELDDLALRIAQVEHRLRLLEGDGRSPAASDDGE
jgi:polyhydroxyalkanoate synthesis regulator phasin